MNYDEELYGANDFRNYELCHHGILGQKWGVRRYQNSDGSLTSDGRKRYGSSNRNSSDRGNDTRKFHLTSKQKTALKIGAAVAGAALAAYGGYKIYQAVQMVDRDSMKTASDIINKTLRHEAIDASTSAKIFSKTGQASQIANVGKKLKSSEGLKKYIAETTAEQIESGRTASNIKKATAQAIKNDVVDAKDLLKTSRLSPFRNPFMDKTDTNKYRRMLLNERSAKINQENIDDAIRFYEQVRSQIANLKTSI